jgi:hypothetical protein
MSTIPYESTIVTVQCVSADNVKKQGYAGKKNKHQCLHLLIEKKIHNTTAREP